MKCKVRYWTHGTPRFEMDRRELPKDMLRYDSAFINPRHPGIFITLKSRDWNGNATPGRWASFSVPNVHELKRDTPSITNPSEWYTYRRKGIDDYEMMTLTEYTSMLKYTLS